VYILGITHPISWNTAAVLLEDGRIIAAAEEERFVRIKRAPRMIPRNSIEFVIKTANLKPNDIDKIAISWEGPHNEEDIDTAITKGISSGSSEDTEKKFWKESLEKEKTLMSYLHRYFDKSKIFFISHHLAHAASACLVSGFKKSLFFTPDGRGEFESGLIGIYENGEFEIIRKLAIAESLGNMYAGFTESIGYKPHIDEGKTMGLAPYGTPLKSMMDIARVNSDNKILIDWDKIYSLHSTKFDGRDPTQDDRKNIAATAQNLLEKCALSIVSNLTEITGNSNLCLAGGTALNIDMNGVLIESGLIKEIFIQPAAHDAGCALGAALYLHQQYSSVKPSPMKHAYWGLDIDDKQIEQTIKKSGLKFEELEDITTVAELISENKIIGWIQGRAEFGPRSLGSRSLLANPTNPEMWKKVNEVKGREYWRPLAPSITEEKVDEFFVNHNIKSPFMLLRFKVKKESEIPAVVHVDGSARPQTVSKDTNAIYWDLLKEFENITGVPVILNTSLNLKGDPIVNTIDDGLKMLENSAINYLCVQNYLIHK